MENLAKKPIVWILGVIAVLAIMFGGMYNGFMQAETEVDSAWANVESKLQRRHDLIPNLVNSVQGEMKQEQEVFGKIADARAAVQGAKTTDDKVAAENELSSQVNRLTTLIVENYPELKSSENVTKLMDELSGTENRISTERDRYNSAVKSFNVKVKRFPGNMVAKVFGFDAKEFFKADAGAEKAPEVSFDK
ncbi:LemA family protein [Vagococcus coleopterorum]|uniref:LemA family protein n=1 Tax=Vagococcus coleopterorum TaxID=2714946 RepID=A0A6G8AP32_9ENTE|nr:LemA family protein [Vagococcus coleopterorum]QIL46702.1 LemA family protein [Vagococcus coleopterorum]